MDRREIVKQALGHKQPARIPVDFGATAVTGMHVTCVANLRQHYGLDVRPVKAFEPYQMLGMLEDDLLDALGVDVVGVPAQGTLFGFTNENWKKWRTPWGQEVLVSEHFRTTETDDAMVIYPQGDTSVGPSGRMPKSGFFFDTIVRQEPIEESRLNPEDNLEEFTPISPEQLLYFEEQTRCAAQSGRAVVANFGGTAIGDIALVPAPFLKHPKGIRDISEWYMSTVMRQDYLHEVFSRQVEIAVENLVRLKEVVGDTVDVVFVCGTDFGTQSGTFCSVETFRDLYAPYYRRINDWIHANTSWKTFKHSCGAVETFLSDIAEAGFDIVNPVQCSAAGMDPETLKQRYGDRLVFWGAGVDTQKTLPFGTPEEVRRQALQRCEIFAAGGGFVFNSIHNVQAGTPVENIVAMVDAAREFNRAGG